MSVDRQEKANRRRATERAWRKRQARNDALRRQREVATAEARRAAQTRNILKHRGRLRLTGTISRDMVDEEFDA